MDNKSTLFQINATTVYNDVRLYVQFLNELVEYEVLLYDEFNRVSDILYKIHSRVLFKNNEDAMYFYLKFTNLFSKSSTCIPSCEFKKYVPS